MLNGQQPHPHADPALFLLMMLARFRHDRFPTGMRFVLLKYDLLLFYLRGKNPELLRNSWNFPGGPGVKDLPVSTGDMGSTPWSGTVPSAEGQLSRCSTTAGSPPDPWRLCWPTGGAPSKEPAPATKGSPAAARKARYLPTKTQCRLK